MQTVRMKGGCLHGHPWDLNCLEFLNGDEWERRKHWAPYLCHGRTSANVLIHVLSPASAWDDNTPESVRSCLHPELSQRKQARGRGLLFVQIWDSNIATRYHAFIMGPEGLTPHNTL